MEGSGPQHPSVVTPEDAAHDADASGRPLSEEGQGTPLLAVEHVEKAFGAVQALLDGSIELYAGEAHALVGENGAGKSTLVKILAGVHQPDAGRVLISGREVVVAQPVGSSGRGNGRDLPGADAVSGSQRGREHLHGPPARRAGRRIDRESMRRAGARGARAAGRRLDPGASRAGSRSPTSRSSRSPRR